MLARSAKNLAKVNLVTTHSLGLLDLLKAEYLVLTSGAVDRLEEKYAKASPVGRQSAKA
jgi:ribosomal protein L4